LAVEPKLRTEALSFRDLIPRFLDMQTSLADIFSMWSLQGIGYILYEVRKFTSIKRLGGVVGYHVSLTFLMEVH
jgi:hypothetical protein